MGLCGGPGIAQQPEQLSCLVSGGPIGKIGGDAHHQGANIVREQLGIAVDAADPAEMIAPLLQALEQLVNPGQNNLGLLGRCGGFQSDASHFRSPLAAPRVKVSLGLLERERRCGKLGPSAITLGLQLRTLLNQIVLLFDHRFGPVQQAGQVRARHIGHLAQIFHGPIEFNSVCLERLVKGFDVLTGFVGLFKKLDYIIATASPGTKLDWRFGLGRDVQRLDQLHPFALEVAFLLIELLGVLIERPPGSWCRSSVRAHSALRATRSASRRRRSASTSQRSTARS